MTTKKILRKRAKSSIIKRVKRESTDNDLRRMEAESEKALAESHTALWKLGCTIMDLCFTEKPTEEESIIEALRVKGYVVMKNAEIVPEKKKNSGKEGE